MYFKSFKLALSCFQVLNLNSQVETSKMENQYIVPCYVENYFNGNMITQMYYNNDSITMGDMYYLDGKLDQTYAWVLFNNNGTINDYTDDTIIHVF